MPEAAELTEFLAQWAIEADEPGAEQREQVRSLVPGSEAELPTDIGSALEQLDEQVGRLATRCTQLDESIDAYKQELQRYKMWAATVAP